MLAGLGPTGFHAYTHITGDANTTRGATHITGNANTTGGATATGDGDHRRPCIGLLNSRGWAQHIVNRWRNALSHRPTAPHTTEIDLAVDEFLSDNPHRGGYHGMHVPGA